MRNTRNYQLMIIKLHCQELNKQSFELDSRLKSFSYNCKSEFDEEIVSSAKEKVTHKLISLLIVIWKMSLIL